MIYTKERITNSVHSFKLPPKQLIPLNTIFTNIKLPEHSKKKEEKTSASFIFLSESLTTNFLTEPFPSTLTPLSRDCSKVKSDWASVLHPPIAPRLMTKTFHEKASLPPTRRLYRRSSGWFIIAPTPPSNIVCGISLLLRAPGGASGNMWMSPFL